MIVLRNKVLYVYFNEVNRRKALEIVKHDRDSDYVPRTDGTPISINCIQQFMRRLAKKAGLEGIKLHPHILRHSFGTQFIINGGNVVHLQAIMGHSSLTTTLKYTHCNLKISAGTCEIFAGGESQNR